MTDLLLELVKSNINSYGMCTKAEVGSRLIDLSDVA